MTTFTCAHLSISDGIAEVTLAATGKANLMGQAYWRELPELFDELGANAQVRVIIIRGEGAHFSYGLNLPEMAGVLAPLIGSDAGARERRQLLQLIRDMQHTHDAVARCTKPVIAAIGGWCIGGAIDLITACDIRLASSDAKFSIRETRLAMVADVGTLARLPGIINEGALRELAFSGDDFDAARALQLGLVSQVTADQPALFAAARALATRIAKNSPHTVQGVKEVLNTQREKRARESLETVALWNAAFLPSADLLEAMGAFMEKREPTFSDT